MAAEAAEEGAGTLGSAATAAEEFLVWKKNAPFLYDLVVSHALEWPSLTVHSPRPSPRRNPNPNGHDRAIRAAPGGGEPRALHAAEPRGGRHEDVRARGARVRPRLRRRRRPDAVLKGHETEGYGLSWSPFREGYLLSGSYDSKICLWDLGGGANGGAILDAKNVFEAHEDLVEDVAWHLKDGNIFGSVGDDHKLMVWDLRSSTSKQPQQSIIAHPKEVNSISFSPFNEWILATASADTTIKLFDLRKLATSLHTFSSHTAEVLQVEWSPNHETVLASSSADRRVMVWDLSRIGDEQSEEDADDGPPELLFAHGGHRANITEFSWNPDEQWVIASVAEDNSLQIWQIAESIFRDDHNMQDSDDLCATA
uniref:Histone-binding protein RBBP4-like N-terminal domain-containing protein n=1 Tax=Ananas comosus var. bracteatus TaxID=296719 RepID=A0A6V7PJ18_ANACO|nr:unnamed protein product [Ananas comosus var. bracteatus]